MDYHQRSRQYVFARPSDSLLYFSLPSLPCNKEMQYPSCYMPGAAEVGIVKQNPTIKDECHTTWVLKPGHMQVEWVSIFRLPVLQCTFLHFLFVHIYHPYSILKQQQRRY